MTEPQDEIPDGVAILREILTQQMGKRCADFDPTCHNCQAWAAFDRIAAPSLEAVVEAALPGMNWFVARGQLKPEEPLFGASILDGDEELGEGEGGTPMAALQAAIESAQGEIARREGSAS